MWEKNNFDNNYVHNIDPNVAHKLSIKVALDSYSNEAITKFKVLIIGIEMS